MQRVKGLFIMSFGRKGTLKRAGIILAFAVVFLSLITAGTVLINKKRDSMVIDGRELDIRVRDESDAIRIAEFFYKDKAPAGIITDEVTIPKSFNDMYEKYNELQKPLGTDLSAYKGFECTRYSLHYPEYEGCGRTMTLLVFDGRLIGGDMSDDLFDGEMVSLYNIPS